MSDLRTRTARIADLAVAGVEDATGPPEEAQEHQLRLLQARIAGNGLQHVRTHL